MPKMLIRKVPNDWIHWVQILSLVLFGMAIWFQPILSSVGIVHRTAMIIAFLGLTISLIIEHK